MNTLDLCNMDLIKRLITNRINKAIHDQIFPGCVLGYIIPDRDPVYISFGRHTYDCDSNKIHNDSVFDVASITKTIPTSSLAIMLIERGLLNLEKKVVDIIPELKNPQKEKLLIKHLLTQTLDFNFRLSAFKESGADGILNAIFAADFSKDPGTSYFYSNATSILLGIVIERISNKKLNDFAQKELFGPLKMDKTSFFPESLNKYDIVPTEFDPWRNRLIQGEIHDESAWVLRKKMIAGSAGLFSTAPDIMKFLQMILNDGFFMGKRYFSKNTIQQMHTNQIEHLGLSAGLGWELNQNKYMGKMGTVHTIGKTGFTGCVCVCDIVLQKAFVLLSNFTYPSRKDVSLINCVRSDIADIILGTETE